MAWMPHADFKSALLWVPHVVASFTFQIWPLAACGFGLWDFGFWVLACGMLGFVLFES
jgi:hypothetical protein